MKKFTKYVCQNCGHNSSQKLGRCPACSEWDSLVEERVDSSTNSQNMKELVEHVDSQLVNGATRLSDIQIEKEFRWSTGMQELDRVLGGGVVAGALVLIGGDPGIGKSTLLLQALEKLSHSNKVLYVTGEESVQQVKLRADRLNATGKDMLLASETSWENVLRIIKKEKPKILAIDSIQTIFTESLESAPGSVSQIREMGTKLMYLAKKAGILTFLVGHVTKEGTIAGPRVLEHLVDTVLYFESSSGHSYRILRGVKNRFGSTNEIGVFEMNGSGLREVSNPSELFLGEREKKEPGTAVVSSMQGTRPILVEIQALVTKSYLPSPRRTSLGLDHQRATLLLAVMEKKWDIPLFNQDVYINVVSGVRLNEPSVDLGVMAAIASSFHGKPLSSQVLFIGEVGLSDEVRAVSQVEERIKEAVSLGFNTFYLPKRNQDKLHSLPKGIEIIPIRRAREILASFS